MKAKIQLIIGLLTAIVCAIGVLIISSEMPPFLIALLFPILYGVTLIKKKLKSAKTIFFIWCGGWLLSCVFFWLKDSFSGVAVIVVSIFALGILELIVTLPIWVPVSPFFEYSLGVRVISGAFIMLLFWIGIRGIKQIIKKEQKVNEDIMALGKNTRQEGIT